MKRTLVTTALLATLGLGIILAQPARPSGTLTLYTSEVLGEVQKQIDAYQAKHPGVEVKVFRSGTGEVTAKLESETAAGNPQADVLWVADQTYFQSLSSRNQLQRVSPTLRGVGAADVYENGLYFEVRRLYNVIGVNTSKLKSGPRSYADLLKPEYRGQLAMPNPLYSGGALSTVGTLVSRLGWDYFENLKKNGLKVEQSNPITTTKLINGEYGAAILVDYSLRREKAKGAPIEAVYPTEGAILVPTPVGVLRSSKNPAAARAFIEHLYSAEGQQIFASGQYVTVVAGAPQPAGVPEGFASIPSAAQYIAENKTQIGERFSAIFGLK